MKLTKLGHACFIVEEQGKKVIVDPGVYTELPSDLQNITAIIVTHLHKDHFDKSKIETILTQNPNAQLYGASEVVSELPGCIEPAKTQVYETGPFKLRFFGDLHELARPGKPQVNNIGVCINDLVAYAGDSYSQFDKQVKINLVPCSAPWLQISAAYDFVMKAQAEITIPTHDALLSEIGMQVYDAHLSEAAEQAGSTYRRLKIGESIEI